MRVHRSCFFTFLNFFRESEKLLLIFLNESVIIDKHFKTLAGVMELADVLDSKSCGSDTVPVRPRSPAPKSAICQAGQMAPCLFISQALVRRNMTGRLIRIMSLRVKGGEYEKRYCIFKQGTAKVHSRNSYGARPCGLDVRAAYERRGAAFAPCRQADGSYHGIFHRRGLSLHQEL